MNPDHFVVSGQSPSNNRLICHDDQSEAMFSKILQGWTDPWQNLKLFRGLNVVGSFSSQDTVSIKEDRFVSQLPAPSPLRDVN